MGRLMLRRVTSALAAGLIALLALAPIFPASAVTIVYTMTVLPLTATAEQATDFTVTVVNVAGPDEIGCLEVNLPATYEIHGVGDPVPSNGDDWTATSDGNTVIAWSESGGGRLEVLESVTFVVTAVPKQAEIANWSHHAHRDHDCGGSEQVGIPVPVTVVPPILPTPTPTPSPTAKPTPKATPRPTPMPTARPTPSPTQPGSPTPTLQPTASPTPAARATPVVPADPGSGTGSAGGPAASPAPAPVPVGVGVVPLDTVRVAYAGADGSGEVQQVGLGTLAMMPGTTVFAVPAAVLGGPGLLVIIAWVVVQALGTATWIPAVRRLRGRDAEPN